MVTRIALLAIGAIVAFSASADDFQYQHGWKAYQNPQPGATYSYGQQLNPYGQGGSQSYGPGGGQSYGPGGGKSYGPGGGQSYGPGGGNSYGPRGGNNPMNPWKPIQ